MQQLRLEIPILRSSSSLLDLAKIEELQTVASYLVAS